MIKDRPGVVLRDELWRDPLDKVIDEVHSTVSVVRVELLDPRTRPFGLISSPT
jgi:hypothetical protein